MTWFGADLYRTSFEGTGGAAMERQGVPGGGGGGGGRGGKNHEGGRQEVVHTGLLRFVVRSNFYFEENESSLAGRVEGSRVRSTPHFFFFF